MRRKRICTLFMILLLVPRTFCYGQSKPTRNKANDKTTTNTAIPKNSTNTSNTGNKSSGGSGTTSSKTAQTKSRTSTNNQKNQKSYVATNKKVNHYLTVNGSAYPVSYSFENTKGSRVLSVSSDENWWCTNPASWCTLRLSGSTISIEYSGNLSGYIRETEFYVKTNNKSIKVTISQKGTPPAKVVAQSNQKTSTNGVYSRAYNNNNYYSKYSSGYSNKRWSSVRDYDNYNLLYAGYNHLNIGGNIGLLPGANFGYEYNFCLAKYSQPIYLGIGAELAFNCNFASDEDLILSMHFPVNFTYLHTFDNDMFIGITAGTKFRFNCMAEDYDYNSFFETKGFKHFQIGWQTGVSIGYNRVGFGFFYNGYNKIAPNYTSNGFTIDMLYKF